MHRQSGRSFALSPVPDLNAARHRPADARCGPRHRAASLGLCLVLAASAGVVTGACGLTRNGGGQAKAPKRVIEAAVSAAELRPPVDQALLASIRDATPPAFAQVVFDVPPGADQAEIDRLVLEVGKASKVWDSPELPKLTRVFDGVAYVLPRNEIVHQELTERGLLRMTRQPIDPAVVSDESLRQTAESYSRGRIFTSVVGPDNANFVTADDEDWPKLLAEGFPLARLIEPRRRALPEFASRGPHPYDVGLSSGVDLSVPEPGSSAEGILVQLTGLLVTGYEELMVERAAGGRWAVASISTPTIIDAPNEAAIEAAFDRRFKRSQALIEEWIGPLPDVSTVTDFEAHARVVNEWFAKSTALQDEAYDQAAREIPSPDTGFEVALVGPEESGRLAAEAIRRNLVLAGDAAEAAIRAIDATSPGLRGKPIAVLGSSAGGLAAPAVAARLRELYGDRVKGLVTVAGGADLLDITLRTKATRSSLRLTRPGETLDRATERRVRDAYLAHNPLDGYNLGDELAGLPTLVIYGRFDDWVPGDSGELLWRRLGKPARMVFWGGHRIIYFLMRSRSYAVGKWLNRAAGLPIAPITGPSVPPAAAATEVGSAHAGS